MNINAVNNNFNKVAFTGEVGVADELQSYNTQTVRLITSETSQQDRLDIRRAVEDNLTHVNYIEESPFDVGFNEQTAAMYKPGDNGVFCYWGRSDSEDIPTFVAKALKFFADQVQSKHTENDDKQDSPDKEWFA